VIVKTNATITGASNRRNIHLPYFWNIDWSQVNIKQVELIHPLRGFYPSVIRFKYIVERTAKEAVKFVNIF